MCCGVLWCIALYCIILYCVCVDANVMSVSDSYYNCNGPDIIWLGGHYKTVLAKDITTIQDRHSKDFLNLMILKG